MTDALAFLTGAQSEQKKDELKLLRQQREAREEEKERSKVGKERWYARKGWKRN